MRDAFTGLAIGDGDAFDIEVCERIAAGGDIAAETPDMERKIKPVRGMTILRR